MSKTSLFTLWNTDLKNVFYNWLAHDFTVWHFVTIRGNLLRILLEFPFMCERGQEV